MNEYLVQRQSLENIADEIRVLSGTTEPLGLDEMKTNVNTANTEVAAQATQIEEIMGLLDGKSVSGGGANIDTCSVRVYSTDGQTCLYNVQYTAFEDGKVVSKRVVESESFVKQNFDITYENVCCGTVFNIYGNSQSGIIWTTNGVEEASGYGNTGYNMWYTVTATAGAIATIQMADDD